MELETILPLTAVAGLLSAIPVLALLLILTAALYVLVRKVGEIDSGEMVAKIGLRSISLTVERRVPSSKKRVVKSHSSVSTSEPKGRKSHSPTSAVSTCACRPTSSNAD